MTNPSVIRIGIVHHLAFEFYPPAENLLTYLSQQPSVHTLLITTPADDGGEKVAQEAESRKVGNSSVLRLPGPNRRNRSLARFWKTLVWHMRAAAALYSHRPDLVLAVETHSALAVWFYRVLFRGRAQLVIQHYEYTSQPEYHRVGNRLLRLNRFFEQRLFSFARRVTQTNPDRLRLFQAENPALHADQLAVWPNYPPAAWAASVAPVFPHDPGGRLRLVFVGAVSLRDTWIGPLAEWISCSGQKHCTLDVYASRCDEETAEFLRRCEGPHLRVHSGGVAYRTLPQLLRKYDVGLILYRGNTLNFVWNETNKLFEYLSCGLDVWFPDCMKSVARRARSDVAPRILETDFATLSELDLSARSNRSHLTWKPWTTGCDDVFAEILGPFLTSNAKSAGGDH